MSVTRLSVTYRNLRGLAGNVRRTLPDIVMMMPRATTITVQRLLGRSDVTRWSNPENLERWWDSRTEVLARQVPRDSRVIEFGAGRCQLPRYLPPGCTYVPSDLTFRQPGTIVCDLNRRPLPDLRDVGATVAVFGGVLEYMRDVPSLVGWLSGLTGIVVVSYDPVKSEPRTLGRALELLRRRHFGYLNNYTQDELIQVFSRAGFDALRMEEWQTQKVIAFGTTGTSAGPANRVAAGPA